MADAHTSYYTQYYQLCQPRLSCGISARSTTSSVPARVALVRVAVADAERLDSAWRDLVMVLRGLLVAGGVIAVLPVVASLVLRQVDVETPRLVAYVAATPFVLAAGVGSIACSRPVGRGSALRSPPC